MAVLSGQKEYAEAEAALEEATTAQPDNIYMPIGRGLFFATQGRLEEALAELDFPAPTPDAVRAWGAYVSATALAQGGRLNQARDQLEEANEILWRYGTPPELIRNTAAMAFISGWMDGDVEAGAADLERLLANMVLDELGPVDRSLGGLSLIYAVIGIPEKAQAFAARYQAEVPSQGDPFGRSQMAVAEAISQISRGVSPEEAGLLTATDLMRCARCRQFYAGHGFELAGETDRAIEAYEAYLQDGFYDGGLFELHLPQPVVHERLGNLYEEAGNVGKAAENYREFARRWAEADPHLQPRVQRALQRAGELEGS